MQAKYCTVEKSGRDPSENAGGLKPYPEQVHRWTESQVELGSQGIAFQYFGLRSILDGYISFTFGSKNCPLPNTSTQISMACHCHTSAFEGSWEN